ncbi:MAG: patatin-like phospholipase family protein [Bacteroidia bacterium]|jgi:NTE family protein|nr:patatin-like phospholipase family protein [Bacteroidia bacterium]
MSKKYKLGIVLSGGGARGFAHIGVLKALNENGIFPDVISCVSAGSIVGSLYADGYTPDEIFAIFHRLELYKLLRFYRPAFGLLRADGLERTLRKQLHASNFENLKIPLHVCTVNFSQAKLVYFNTGDIVPAVMASCAIPMVLKPIELNGEFYVDGGLMNNLPVEPLLHHCENIIGVNVNPVMPENKFASFRNFSDRVMHLALRANIEHNIRFCDIYLEPEGLMKYHLFKTSASQEIFRMGYQYTISKITEIKNELRLMEK